MKTLIVGSGHLARCWIEEARRQNFESKICGVTRTSSRHSELRALGVSPYLSDATWGAEFDFVLVMVPPSSVQRPIEFLAKWAETLKAGGRLWMVSSTGVYIEKSGGWVDEGSAVDPSHPLVEWEQFCLKRGLGVLRLAGLYDRERGPHKVYQRSSERPGFGGEYVNLIHTEDAARLLLKLMKSGELGLRVGCDGHPLKRDELATEAAKLLPGSVPCRFTETSGNLGKRVRSQYPHPFKHVSFQQWVLGELN